MGKESNSQGSASRPARACGQRKRSACSAAAVQQHHHLWQPRVPGGDRAHFQGTIEEHTRHVLDELEKNLILAGSSMEKVLKVNVYLSDIANYDKMNSVYAGHWGSVPPVRTTVAVASLPGNSLVEIDCVASL